MTEQVARSAETAETRADADAKLVAEATNWLRSVAGNPETINPNTRLYAYVLTRRLETLSIPIRDVEHPIAPRPDSEPDSLALFDQVESALQRAGLSSWAVWVADEGEPAMDALGELRRRFCASQPEAERAPRGEAA